MHTISTVMGKSSATLKNFQTIIDKEMHSRGDYNTNRLTV